MTPPAVPASRSASQSHRAMDIRPSVLLIEDDASVRLGLEQALALADIPVRAFERAEPALERIAAGYGGVVVTDVRLPGMDGLACLARVMAVDRDIPVVLITGHGGVSMAVQAMREGAYDFIEKPSVRPLVDVCAARAGPPPPGAGEPPVEGAARRAARGAPDRRSAGDPEHPPPGGHARPHRGGHPHLRRHRHRQGGTRPCHPRGERAARRVRRHQLRRAARVGVRE